jgi:hypothetical protein
VIAIFEPIRKEIGSEMLRKAALAVFALVLAMTLTSQKAEARVHVGVFIGVPAAYGAVVVQPAPYARYSQPVYQGPYYDGSYYVAQPAPAYYGGYYYGARRDWGERWEHGCSHHGRWREGDRWEHHRRWDYDDR